VEEDDDDVKLEEIRDDDTKWKEKERMMEQSRPEAGHGRSREITNTRMAPAIERSRPTSAIDASLR
jgi:hypothetical protein